MSDEARRVGFAPDAVIPAQAPKPTKRVVPRADATNVRFLTKAEHAKVIADRRAKTAAEAELEPKVAEE